MESKIFDIRSMTLDDKNFIYATWLRGLYYGNAEMRRIDQEAFFKHYPAVVTLILSKPTTVLVACLNSDPDVILGYSVASYDSVNPGILHWVYVKEAWRQQGIAKSLIANRDLEYRTHYTEAVEKVNMIKNLTYNPFLI